MLQINERNRIYGEEIHRTIESKNNNYRQWLNEKLEYADLQQEKDFFTILLKSSGGRPKTQYEFTLDAAKEICLLEKNEKAKQIRRWLIDLSKQLENRDVVPEREILLLSTLIGFFKYLENQIKVYEKHKQQFVEETKTKNNPYAEFHIMRNRILQIDKQLIEKNLQVYCIEQNKRFPKLNTTRDKILFMDAYDSLKNAVWDFLYMNGSPTALKLATLAKNMAKAQGLDLFEHNEENIFQTKEMLKEPKMLN